MDWICSWFILVGVPVLFVVTVLLARASDHATNAKLHAMHAATTGATAGRPAASVEARLQELERLRATDMITADEYAAKRQRIIDEL